MDEEVGLTLCGLCAARHLPTLVWGGAAVVRLEVIPSVEITLRYALAPPAWSFASPQIVSQDERDNGQPLKTAAPPICTRNRTYERENTSSEVGYFSDSSFAHPARMNSGGTRPCNMQRVRPKTIRGGATFCCVLCESYF